jgi:hypothetical protein
VSTAEGIVLGVGLPLLVILGWVQSVRVWRSGADVSVGMSWFSGRASVAGYHGFLLPATISFTLAGLGILMTATTSSGVVYTIGMWALGLSLPFLGLSFWVWLFAWPRFLMPPHLRGSPGWIGALWREHRQTREEDRVLREQLRQHSRRRSGRG